ncbi:MAG: T9SS type A sorting domain-containing protein [Bacteroidales bacterium]|nr:T9SS type A sorting domain-containing protein [Bacteroidales bacterium]
MKKFTFKNYLMVLMLMVFGTTMAQLPEAITMEPENPTAWDEITLTLDATKSCPAESLYGAGVVMMHSGVTLDGAAWSNVIGFNEVGANDQKPELVPAPGPLPAAISMVPRYAKATDTITITLNTKLSCPDSALFAADSVMMHSGVTLDGAAWSNVIAFDTLGANGQQPKLVDNGDSTWSITIIPSEFYGVTAGEVTAINCVFNEGDWTAEGKDFDDEGNCIDFVIPLVTEYAHTWSITFVPADFYGIDVGADVSAIDGVFNAGDWALGEGKDFDVDLNCVDFKIPLSPVGLFEIPEVSFNMYPNPVENLLYITNLEGANNIEIYNILGEKVITVDNVTGSEISIETSDLVSGFYFLTIYNNGQIQSVKFMKN